MGYDFNRTLFLPPCRVRHLSKRELDRQLRQTNSELDRAKRVIKKIRIQAATIALQLATVEGQREEEKVIYDRQMLAVLNRLTLLEIENEALRRVAETYLPQNEPLNIRAWMASFKDLAPYVFAGFAAFALAGFVIWDRTHPVNALAGEQVDAPASMESASPPRFDFHERKVSDLEKELPPGDMTVEEWLGELEQSERVRNWRRGDDRHRTFMGGQQAPSDAPSNSEWHVE